VAATAIARLIRWLRRIGGVLALLAGVYMLAAWIGSSVPRNAAWHETGADYVIGLETNGVHTALVLPIVTPEKDWRQDFPLADLRRPDRPYTHVSISWGEHEVFLDTPTWWDLSPRTVLDVLLFGGRGLSHVAYYARPSSGGDLRPIRLTREEYRRLVRSIEGRLPRSRPFAHYPGYGSEDAFYETGGTYTAVHTCNQWTANRLADAGVRVGRWTPIASGLMKWIAPASDPRALMAAPSHPYTGAGARR